MAIVFGAGIADQGNERIEHGSLLIVLQLTEFMELAAQCREQLLIHQPRFIV